MQSCCFCQSYTRKYVPLHHALLIFGLPHFIKVECGVFY